MKETIMTTRRFKWTPYGSPVRFYEAFIPNASKGKDVVLSARTPEHDGEWYARLGDQDFYFPSADDAITAAEKFYEK